MLCRLQKRESDHPFRGVMLRSLESASFPRPPVPDSRDLAGRRVRRPAPAPGFTLIEVIGILALVAILAAVFLPRVMGAIQRGKVSGTAQSLGGLTGVIAEYAVRSNALPVRLGNDVTNAATAGGRFDADLLQAGLVERLFATPLGSQASQGSGGFGCAIIPETYTATSLLERAHVRSAPGGASSLVPVATSINAVNFDLDRDGTADFTASQMVAYAYIPSVGRAEAAQLNQLLDGDLPVDSSPELGGRCIQSAPDSDHKVTVYVHLGHY